MIVNERVGRAQVRTGLAAINDDAVMQALKEQATPQRLMDVKSFCLKPHESLLGHRKRVMTHRCSCTVIKGEGAKRARFIVAARQDVSQELVEKFGEEKARKALQVEMRHERAKRGEVRRGGAVGIDPIAQIQRAKDVEAREAGYKAEYDFEAERNELLKLMNKGATVDAPFELGEGNRVIEAAPAGRRLVVPNDSSFGGRKPLLDKGVPISEAPGWQRHQPIQEAPAPMSIAPEPGAGTGNQAAPMIDAGGSGSKPPTRTAVSGGPMPDGMRNELFSMKGPYQKKYMADPDGPEKAVEDAVRRMKEGGKRAFNVAKDYATNPKYQRGRRIGYGVGGGVAALATILNMGTEEEQEQLR